MSGLWLISYLLLWGLVLVLAVVLVSVLRHIGVVYRMLNERTTPAMPLSTLTPGAPAPPLLVQTLSGDVRQLPEAADRGKALLVISPGCHPCRDLLRALAEDRVADTALRVGEQPRVISVGSAAETVALLTDYHLVGRLPVLLDDRHQLAAHWGIRQTPTMIVFDTEGRVSQQHIPLPAPPS